MKTLFPVVVLLLCNVGLFGQVSPIFPTRAVTDADMWVSSDVCSMNLAYPLGPADTTVQVTTAVGCPTSNFLIKIEKEVIGISSVSGVVLSVATSGRGYGSTIAVGHARGQTATAGYFSYQQNRDAAEIEALEAFLMSGTGTAAWGHILGDLANQGDLAGALGGKQETLTDYSTISGLTGYPSTFPPTTSGDWTGVWQTHAPAYFQTAISGAPSTWPSTFPPITTGLALLASANSFTAGAKQTFSQSATTAGLNFGALFLDPSGLAEGDFWYNAGILKIRQGAATKTLAFTDQLPASVTGIRKSAGAGTTDSTAAAADVYGLWSGTKDSSHCTAGDGTMQLCAGGGSGSGTVNAGTATHLAYYASSTPAVSDAGADFTYDGSHTYTVGTLGIIDATTAGAQIRAVTQSQGEGSTKVATTSYVDTGLSGKAASGAATTVNGQSCALGSSCTVPLSAVNHELSTYQVQAADFSAYKTITVASGTFTITLVPYGSGGATQPPAGQYIKIINYGTGVVTVARSGQSINGGTASLTIYAGSATAPTDAFIVSDGSDYFVALNALNGPLVGDANGTMGANKVQFAGVAILPPVTSADIGRIYRNTEATTANVCVSGDTGGTAKAACVTLDGTTWTALGGSGGAANGFTSLVTPSTSMTLTCPQNSSGVFIGNAALSGNVTVTSVSGCPGSTSVSAQLSFSFQQPTPIGGGPYTVTLPSPFDQCDFSMVTAGVTLTETGTYNGTNYLGVTCSPSSGPSLDAGPKPTVTGCGTTGTPIGNALVGSFTSGQTTCTPVLSGLPTAPHGYNCTITERATGAQYGNVSDTVSSATFPAITTTSGDVMAFSCRAD